MLSGGTSDGAGTTSLLPAPLLQLVEYLDGCADQDARSVVASFLASCLHPDFVCNLSLTCHLDATVRQAMREAFVWVTSPERAETRGELHAELLRRAVRHLGAPVSPPVR